MTNEKANVKKDTILTPGICSDFPGGNGDQVQFQNVPPAGCTLWQNGANNVFPFTPNTQGPNGLQATIYPGNILTIAVPALNKKYTYVVGCCSQAQATHTVTVP